MSVTSKASKKFIVLMLVSLMLFSLSLVLKAITQIANAATQATYYVDGTNGSDSNSGTLSQPFASIMKARDIVRTVNSNMTGDIIIKIRGGNYYLTNSISLTDADSGTNGYKVIYRNFDEGPVETPKIYGGTPVTGWTLHSGSIYKVSLGAGTAFYNLIENDVMANPVKSSLANVTSAGDWYLDQTNRILYYWPRNASISSSTIVVPKMQDIFRMVGSSSTALVKNVQLQGLSLNLTDYAASFSAPTTFTANGHTYNIDGAENESNKHALIFMENAQNNTVLNCQLFNAGLSGVWLNKYAQQNTIYGNWIQSLGLNGVYLTGWTIGDGPFTNYTDPYVNKFNTISNNYIYDIGKLAYDPVFSVIGYWRGTGIQLYQSGDNEISYNKIQKGPRYAVSQKGERYGVMNQAGSFYGVTVTYANHKDFLYTRNNVIKFNEISKMMSRTTDGGAIESWGIGINNVVNNNRIHALEAINNWNNWFGGIYLDDASDYMTVQNNILYDIHGGTNTFGILEKGINNTITNNILANNELGWDLWLQPFAEASYGLTLTDNILYNNNTSNTLAFDKLPDGFAGSSTYTVPLTGTIPNRISSANNNLINHPSGTYNVLANNSTISYASYKSTYGYDANSITGSDPLFVDAANRNYTLQSGSPALSLGFTNIDQANIGLKSDFPWNTQQIIPAGNTTLAVNYDSMMGVRTVAASGSVPSCVGYVDSGDYIEYDAIDFGTSGKNTFNVLASSTVGTGQIEVRLDSLNGTLIGTLNASNTGSWNTYTQQSASITPVFGTHKVYLKFTSSLNLSSFSFSAVGSIMTNNWKLDETSGTTAADSTSSALNGTVNGGATWKAGIYNNGLSFNGTNAYVNIPDTTNPAAFSVGMWVMPYTTSAQNIFTRTNSTGATSAFSGQLRINSSGKFETYMWDGAGKTVTGTTTIQANTWYHVALVASNNGQMKLYVNGVQEGTPASIGTMWAGGDRYWIGSNSGGGFGWFYGMADEVKFYNHDALSDTEVLKLANPNLRGNWKLDETTGTSAADSSGNSLTGTVNGGGTWTTGKFNNGLSFNGSNAYVNIPDSLNPSSMAISLWVKPSVTTAQNIIVRTSSAGAGSAYSHQLRINSSGKFEAYMYDGAVKTVTGTTTVQANTWYHLALVATNSGSMKLYVNGVQEGTPANISTMWTGGDRYWIGSNSGGGFGWFNGVADNVKIYSSSLNDNEVASLAGAITGPTPLSRTGWTASASNSHVNDPPIYAIDSTAGNYWTTGVLQSPGMWYSVNLGSQQTFNKLKMDIFNNSAPVSYEVYVSNDGVSWGSAIASGSGTSPATEITFTAQTAQYVKVVETGSSSSYWWAISELNLYNN